jgi:uncharacterized protein (DUF1330 family)
MITQYAAGEGYIVFLRERTLDEAELERHMQMVPATLTGRGAIPRVVYGNVEILEGEPFEALAILEFSSTAEAKAWYASPAYQASLEHRYAGAKYRVFIVEGVRG